MATYGPDVERLCDACVAHLPGVSGAGLAVMTSLPAQQPRYTSDEVSARIEDLQVTLGEGPCQDAFAGGLPVLAADLDHETWRRQWPAFAPAALAAGARALFALPLKVGAIGVGVMDLYRDAPGALDGDELADALVFADAATQLLLAESVPDGGSADNDKYLGNRAVVHQATGMVSAQLDVAVAEAFVRLRAYAYAEGRTLEEVACDVVDRRLRFDDLDD